jgi:hypothetical protein
MIQSARSVSALFLTAFVGFTLACTGATTVAGERAALGTCPEGEVCSDKAPAGLMFQGQMLYDEGADRLGPVLVGGRFDLSFFPQGYALQGKWAVEVEGADARIREGAEPGVELKGTEVGTAVVRVIDPETGHLYDRLSIEVVALEDIELTNVTEPERPALKAGCEEMVGIRMLAAGGSLRAFDQDLKVRAPDVVADPFAWDCFRYEVPLDATEVTFEMEVAGEIWERTLPVEPLDEGEACPQLRD